VGHSYGCHDNYLMRRDVPWDRIVSDVTPFLVTRQIFAGAGKVGIESEGNFVQQGVFQISQRSDFFQVLMSIDTMNRRPIVNTRDEPHADVAKYRRFHVIIGDSNMSEIATALKIGTTALVLDLIEQCKAPQLELANPVEATKSISRDQTYAWILELKDGRKISAVDIQRLYLDAAERHCSQDEETAWLLREWKNVLNDLQRDVMQCRDRIDWVAKKFLLAEFRESEGLEWSDPWLQSIDLEYHNVSMVQGLYYELVRSGQMRQFVSEKEIKDAIFHPPQTTRAFFRGRAVARFNREIAAIQWDQIVFRGSAGSVTVDLNHAFSDDNLDRWNRLIRDAPDFDAFIKAAQ